MEANHIRRFASLHYETPLTFSYATPPLIPVQGPSRTPKNSLHPLLQGRGLVASGDEHECWRN